MVGGRKSSQDPVKKCVSINQVLQVQLRNQPHGVLYVSLPIKVDRLLQECFEEVCDKRSPLLQPFDF